MEEFPYFILPLFAFCRYDQVIGIRKEDINQNIRKIGKRCNNVKIRNWLKSLEHKILSITKNHIKILISG